jgi:integrase
MSRSLADISKRDLINCVDRRRATAPGVAEQSLRYAKPFFRWMYERGLSENLLHDVRAAQTNKRDRTLSMVELGRVLLALDEMGDEAPALCIRTLIATAGRLNEVAGMRASEIDGDLWTLPGERNKSKRVHLVPLNAEAQAAISRGYDRGLVFPGKRGVFNGWSRFKNRLNAACGVSDWVFHDMRRSFASVCADKGVDPIVADRCLNHAASGTQSIVMRIYQRSEMLEQRRAALNIWSDALAEARAVAHGQRVGELTT